MYIFLNFSCYIITILGSFITSGQFSHSVMSYSLQPHGLQHSRLPCPTPIPRTCSNSCPWSHKVSDRIEWLNNNRALKELLWWLSGKELSYQAGDIGLIPGSGRSLGEGNGNPLQYSCLGNAMDRGAWWAPVRGVAESDMTEQLPHSLFTFT